MEKKDIINLIESEDEELEGKLVKYSSAADGHVSELTAGETSNPNHNDPKRKGHPASSPPRKGIHNGNAEGSPEFSIDDVVTAAGAADDGSEQFDDF